MDEKKFIRDGRAFGVNEVRADILHIDENYELKCYSGNRATGTGRLVVAALKPKKKSLPEFLFRWDENADALDVDISGVSSDIRQCFERGMNGYAGHRTKRVGKDKIFEVSIKIPKSKVFAGHITSPLHRELELTESLALSKPDLQEPKIRNKNSIPDKNSEIRAKLRS